MNAYRVTVTRTFTLLIGRTQNMASARRFAEQLLKDDQVADSDWDQVIAVEPYDPAVPVAAGDPTTGHGHG